MQVSRPREARRGAVVVFGLSALLVLGEIGYPARLAEVENIIGLKQSQDDLGQLVETIRLCGESISICTGIDSQFYAALCVGATGIFSTAATICPRQG